MSKSTNVRKRNGYCVYCKKKSVAGGLCNRHRKKFLSLKLLK